MYSLNIGLKIKSLEINLKFPINLNEDCESCLSSFSGRTCTGHKCVFFNLSISGVSPYVWCLCLM